MSNHVCPKCGAALGAEAPQALCPKCLLAVVTTPTDAGSSGGASLAPALAEVAAAFPQLEILELIGRGGMGVVFKARQPKLDRFVALKILPQSLAADAAFAERFTREGRMLARLSHPNVVTIHDFGLAGGFFYLLMEFVDGVNLRQAMKAGRFTPAQALAVVPKICEALQYAHNEGVLHRDIKPENILLDAQGRVKIADFGIAKLVSDPRGGKALTASGAALGTPHYMAPEQIEKPGEVDHRADIYSLGVVFYEMLTGELPLGRFAPPSEKSTADPRLDEVIFRTLAKEPARRPQSAGEVKTQVETIVESTPQVEPASSRQAGDWRLPLRWRRGVALLGACGVVLLIVFMLRRNAVLRPDDSTGASAAKIVELVGATNSIRGDANEVRTVSVTTHSSVLPGESILSIIKHPDGTMTESSTGFFVHRRANRATTMCIFSWFFPESFSVDQMADATEQIRRDRCHRPIALIPDERLPMFAVTNRFGAVLAGYLLFKRSLPAATAGQAPGKKPSATVWIKTDWPIGSIVYFSASVPPGYSLEATAQGVDPNEGEAHTSFFHSSRGPQHHASWHSPRRFTWEEQRAADAQILKLAQSGPIEVAIGEPHRLFSITNGAGEVFSGFFELFGSRTDETPPARSAALPPTAAVMRSLASRIADGAPSAFGELCDTAEMLYRGIDLVREGPRADANLALMRAAFTELGTQSGSGNQKAFEALKLALATRDLSAFAPDALGLAAAAGHAESLDMLLNHDRHRILLSSAVFALGKPAENGNEKAIDFLIGVLARDSNRPLWQGAAGGLKFAASTGHAKAKAAVERYDATKQK